MSEKPAVHISRWSASCSLRSKGAGSWSGAADATDQVTPVVQQNSKVLHFVRHAQGVHNIDKHIMRQPEGLDAQLTDEGRQQCGALAKRVCNLKPELVVTSPLTRTMQTTLLSFGTQLQAGVPVVALESVRETVNFYCDARRSLSTIVSDLAPDFARVGATIDTSIGCPHDHDELWASYVERHGPPDTFTSHRETADLPSLAARARAAFAWLGARAEHANHCTLL